MKTTQFSLRAKRPGSRLWMVLIAFGISVLIVIESESWVVEERLITLQAQEQFGRQSVLLDQPLSIQALLLDYRNDELLWLKAQAALHVYPEYSRLFFKLFGEEPEFRQALKANGEQLIPPLVHFYQNPVNTIEVMNKITGSGDSLSPEQRAWYAINFANQEGSDFTGQFLVAPDGTIEWIWTERITEGVVQFFTSGIRTLESRYRTDQDIRARDLGWAAVDMAIIGSAVKFLKAGRAAATTARTSTIAARSASYTSRLARAGQLASTMVSNARWPAFAALAYVAVKHPVVLNDLFAGAANVLGVPAWMVQIPGWFFILLPLLVILRWLLRTILWLIPARH
ncbi:hypothetical protein [Marinobacter sp.]|uniref:hypothetical protein n=1 Tax=Marinobacter sp. TaxID=50741 RepID=UPI00356AD70F